jgi:glycosyltransferase involved in cell wall biosynthesis
MATADRPHFVQQAVWYFLRQEYPACELIVLDHGRRDVADLIPRDDRLRYVRIGPCSPGRARNLGCELARGDLVAHWSDDDWSGPDRLRRQVAALAESGAAICGARELLYYRVDEGDAHWYRHPADLPSWLAGGTLMYRRAAWAERPFTERAPDPDAEFVRGFAPDRLHPLADSSCWVALIHAGSTFSRDVRRPRWEPCSLDEVVRRWGNDSSFYLALRHGRARATQQRPPRAATPTITLAATFVTYDGYGSMAEYLALGMARAGAAVDLLPFHVDRRGLSDELESLLGRSRPDPRAPTLCFAWWGEDLGRFRSADELYVNTMWETSRLPADWPRRLNRARAVIVPTRWAAGVFQASGVTVPIEVVPQGIDPDVYRYEERPDRAGLTTLMVGVFVPRKNMEYGIAAWKEAFAGDPDARLIVKSRFRARAYEPDDARIRFVDSEEPTRGIAHWYRQADVLMALGNEGFGLPLVEAMAVGLPVIALDSEGQGDVCEDAADHVLAVPPARWQPVEEPPYGSCGVRGIPAVSDVADRLRWVDTHRAEARTLGRAASAWVHQHRNVWTMGPAVLDVLERHARPPRPLRQVHVIWAAGERPGPAPEDADHLAAVLPSVRVVQRPPDLRGARILHVLHEPGRFDDRELASFLQQAHYAGVPTAVTEYVDGGIAAWERDADVLVAPLRSGAARLRERWPKKTVVHLPMGCPAWSPSGSAARGRAVAVLGASRSTRLWLHDVITRVPGAALLPADPVDGAGPGLAAQADLLVCWDDAGAGMDGLAAARAIRRGLATGVPLLVAPSLVAPDGPAEDLRDVTWQPAGPDPASLRDALERLLDDTTLRARLIAAARTFCEDHTWRRTGDRHLELWRTLEAV